MTRNLYELEPRVINTVSSTKRNSSQIIEIATGNKNKLKEFQQIFKGYQVIGKDLHIDEIQSANAIEVAEKKAKAAWEKNNFQPILVEDTSLEINALGGKPGPYVKDFMDDDLMREELITNWMSGKSRKAVAKVILALFDGKEVHSFIGAIEGKISEQRKGTNGFGFDDVFIPKGESKTFAEMTPRQKQSYSMRKIAADQFLSTNPSFNYPVYELPEPYGQELLRLRLDELQNSKARSFAYALECIEDSPKKDFSNKTYREIIKEKGAFFDRFAYKGSHSLGLLFTDIDRSSIKTFRNGDPIIWQMGPNRRKLALAQRAEYFLDHQNKQVHKILEKIDTTQGFTRANTRSSTIEMALGANSRGDFTNTIAIKEIGYKKRSSKNYVSRTDSINTGLYTKVGKFGRSIFGIGSMPPVSGWRDVLVTSALGHMPVFTHRNSLHAINPDNQIKLINSAKKSILNLDLGKESEQRALRNIGAAIGNGNVAEEVKLAEKLYKKSNVKLFRIYTINSDPRVIETARALRASLGEDIEIFVGQIADKSQCLELIEPDIKVDGLIFGHGGGMQCTSATNGMALTTLEEIYNVTTDSRFNNTTIVAEGGIGRSVGGLLIMGVDLILSNQKFVKGAIELTDFFFEHKNGKLVHPYHGSASAATMLIESENKEVMRKRMFASGRAQKVEGQPGYMFFEEKVNSMAFHVSEFKHFAARTLADLGVHNISELREQVSKSNEELLRVISPEAAYTGNAHGFK